MTTETRATNWNLADIWEQYADRIPDRTCQIHGERVVTWAEFDRRASALAADLLDAGLGHQSKVACYLYNGPEYLQTYFAAMKVSAVPLNTNFRYGADEIEYVYDNADVEAVVFHSVFTDVVEQVRHRLPGVKRWYWVAEGDVDGPAWATSLDDVIARHDGAHPVASWPRSGDDLILLYTGGTTGMPKGVMWRQDDLVNALGAGGSVVSGAPPHRTLEELVARAAPDSALPLRLIACPLMHGTGSHTSFVAMMVGGGTVTLVDRKFQPAELFSTIERRRVTALSIVGQAFAAPMLEHLDANPGRYDLSSLAHMSSSGVMWSHENKLGLLRHMPDVVLVDAFGSSEAIGIGRSLSSEGLQQTATFSLGRSCAVFTEDGKRVEPGSGERGLLAVGGHIPTGYYKDPVKSAAAFPIIEGQRWSVPGDYAEVNADGTVRLLGRGSSCINTGGEKVFPEEIEEVLKTHPSVSDAVVVGLPDVRFGEIICAVVEPAHDRQPELDVLAEHVKARLAGYKAPRLLVLVDSIGRAANGKVDHPKLKALAAELAAPVPPSSRQGNEG